MKKFAFIYGGSNHNSSIYRNSLNVTQCMREQGYQLDYIFWEPLNEARPHEYVININGLSSHSKFSRFFRKITKSLLGYHLTYYLFGWYFSKQLDQYLTHQHYDFAFLQGTNGLPVWRIKTPHAMVLRSQKSWCFLSRYPSLLRPIYRAMYAHIYRNKPIAAVSQGCIDDFIQTFGYTPPDTQVVYNGYDFAQLRARGKASINADWLPKKYFVAAGRADRSKRFDKLLRAYRLAEVEIPLVIFGNGKGFTKLRKLAEQLNISDKVILPGYVHDLLPYFARASAFILSSDYEGLPNVVAEALAVKTPVIATDICGVKELIPPNLHHWVVDADDETMLAARIKELAASPPQLDSYYPDYLSNISVANNYLAFANRNCPTISS